MNRLGIVKGVVSGGDGDRLAAALHWHDADPERIIAAASVRGSEDVPLPDLGVLRKAFAERRMRVLGEITAQYAGHSLSDPLYDPYLALAESTTSRCRSTWGWARRENRTIHAAAGSAPASVTPPSSRNASTVIP
jgi:hypothetical protein